jgi:hypothetical protein
MYGLQKTERLIQTDKGGQQPPFVLQKQKYYSYFIHINALIVPL